MLDFRPDDDDVDGLLYDGIIETNEKFRNRDVIQRDISQSFNFDIRNKMIDITYEEINEDDEDDSDHSENKLGFSTNVDDFLLKFGSRKVVNKQ